LPVAGCFPRQSGEDSPGNAILWGASCLAARPSWHRPPGARPSWPLSSMRAGSPRSSRNNKGAPMRRGALVGCALVSLEQKLQSQLDLTRVLGGEACRSDVPKVHVIVVPEFGTAVTPFPPKFGGSNVGWLRMLKNSPRNWRLNRSLSLKF